MGRTTLEELPLLEGHDTSIEIEQFVEQPAPFLFPAVVIVIVSMLAVLC